MTKRVGMMNGRYGMALLALAILPASAAWPEGLRLGGGTSGRMALFGNQVNLLDGRLSEQYSASVRLRPKPFGDEDAANVTYSGKYRGLYLAKARDAASRHGVPEDMFLRLVNQESGWNPTAVSPKGAVGLAQLMPETAAHLGVDINDPDDNLDGGARYLRMMFDRFGSWRLALAAYNAGPIAVENAGGVPDYAETQAYVAAILG
jgi:soluble lytic murein transglycosylase-like protein